MTALAKLVLKSRSQAALLIMATGLLGLFIPILPFGLISGGAIALVALRNNTQESLNVFLLASISSIVLLVWMLDDSQSAVTKLLMVWLPVLFSAVVLRISQSLSLALMACVLLASGAAASLMVLGIYPDLEQVQAFFEQAQWFQRVELTEEKRAAALRLLSQTAFAIFLLFEVALCLFLGRWLQAKLYQPGAFGEEFCQLFFGKGLLLAAAAFYLLLLFTQQAMFLVVMLLIIGLYFFQGLAVIHTLARKMPDGQFWMIGLYVLIILFGPLVFLVTLIGIIDTWVNFRRRINATN